MRPHCTDRWFRCRCCKTRRRWLWFCGTRRWRGWWLRWRRWLRRLWYRAGCQKRRLRSTKRRRCVRLVHLLLCATCAKPVWKTEILVHKKTLVEIDQTKLRIHSRSTCTKQYFVCRCSFSRDTFHNVPVPTGFGGGGLGGSKTPAFGAAGTAGAKNGKHAAFREHCV